MSRKPGKPVETVTQTHHARKGAITKEMLFVAERDNMEPGTIRDEVARGRMIIPANVNHASLEPMCIGGNSRIKINANIGNSQANSDIDTEIEKLRKSLKYGPTR